MRFYWGANQVNKRLQHPSVIALGNKNSTGYPKKRKRKETRLPKESKDLENNPSSFEHSVMELFHQGDSHGLITSLWLSIDCEEMPRFYSASFLASNIFVMGLISLGMTRRIVCISQPQFCRYCPKTMDKQHPDNSP